MQRTQNEYATEDNRFTEGNPAAGVPATVVTDDWLNGVQEEIMAVIETAGLEADGEDLTQLYQAIANMIAEGIPDNTTPVGAIELLPFRADALPDGWYMVNGDQYAVAAPQGVALLALPADYRTDWGIQEAGGYVNVPDLFDTGGNGYFLRPVDGSTRQVGGAQTDAIRNIVGQASNSSGSYGFLQRVDIPASTSGALAAGDDTTYSLQGTTSDSGSFLKFDASLVVPTASENRPVNRGMTPAIYLGV
jgi:hypothetical protein